MKLHIMMGLPGSGKTTQAKKMIEKSLNPTLRYVDLDQKDRKKTLKWNLSNPYCTYILDGLFLTNADIVSVIQIAKENQVIEKVTIHFWREDREACLHNDRGRRDLSAENTIRYAKLEEPDLSELKEKTGISAIHLLTYSVVRKPLWKAKAEELGLSVEKERYLCSNTWSLRGSYGSCDGVFTPVGPEEQQDFTELDDFLEENYPELNFRTYKKILRECVTMETESKQDYYGGVMKYAHYQCDLEKLFSILEGETKYE